MPLVSVLSWVSVFFACLLRRHETANVVDGPGFDPAASPHAAIELVQRLLLAACVNALASIMCNRTDGFERRWGYRFAHGRSKHWRRKRNVVLCLSIRFSHSRKKKLLLLNLFLMILLLLGVTRLGTSKTKKKGADFFSLLNVTTNSFSFDNSSIHTWRQKK